MGRSSLLRLRRLVLILCALGTAVLTGFGIASLTNGSTPATPVHLPAGSSTIIAPAPTATIGRRTLVRGESDTSATLESAPIPEDAASAAGTSSSGAPSAASAPGTAPGTGRLDTSAATPASPRASSFPLDTAEPLVQDSFGSSASGWIVRDAATWSAAYTEGQYQLALHGQNNLNLSSSIPAGDYQLSVDVAVTQGGAGVVFLAAKPATFYRIMINVDGLYALQLQRENDVLDIIPWTASDSLRRPAGAAQRLHIERRGTTMQVFANDQVLLRWSIPAGDTVNQYGFAITAQQGAALARFDNLVVEQFLRP